MSVKGKSTKITEWIKFNNQMHEINEIRSTEGFQEEEHGLGVIASGFFDSSTCIYRAPPSPEAGKHPPRTGEAAPIAVRIGRTHPKAEIEEKAVAVAPKIRHAQRVS